MKFLNSVILTLISFLFSVFCFSPLETNAYWSFPDLETKIFSESKSSKITKLQLALKEFWLYNWPIDWNYNSVKWDLIKYQKNTWITKDFGYFWVKTLKALQGDFPNKFDKITKKYLLMEKPNTHVRYFFLTAYYSPLPNQKRYSYNHYKKRYRTYEEEKRLQWEGKKTASWKKVFEWVLAWPRNYPFWTKIEFEWLWVWVIEDRWWAIVNSWERGHEFDRIDVWMWYWDEWLQRALKWWKRKVKGKIVPNTRDITLEFSKSVVDKYKWLTVDLDALDKNEVIRLQKLFKELSLYKWDINWEYSSIRNDLINYQIKKWIITSANSKHAWYFWPKTYAALREDFWWEIFEKKNNKLDEDIILPKNIKDSLDKIKYKIENIISKKYWANSLLASRYRKKIRNKLHIYSNKTNDVYKKRKLQYLKSIL